MFGEHDTVGTLYRNLASCSKFIEAGDLRNFEQSVFQLAEFLNSVSESLLEADSENEEFEAIAAEIPDCILEYLALPSTKQEVIDALAFEVPKAVARFACASRRCLEIAENIVDIFVERCTPRDMLSVLCEALHSPSELFMVPEFFIPLLHGLMKVLVLVKRREYEHLKTVMPPVLKVLKIMSSNEYNEDADYEILFHKATGIANSIWTLCSKLEGKENHKPRAFLSLYVLQIMALLPNGAKSLPLVLELVNILHHCEFSYDDLLTECKIDDCLELIHGDGWNARKDCFSLVNTGAALAVIWSYKTAEVAAVFKADLSTVILELQGNWTKRLEAVRMLKHIFQRVNISWELKKYAVEFLLHIMDGILSSPHDDHLDLLFLTIIIYTSLQAIQMVIMYTPDAVLRKNAFSLFKKVLADVPTAVRFDVLRALIAKSDSSSMIAILLDLVRAEMLEGSKKSSSHNVFNNEVSQSTLFWSSPVLELVEMVLRPLDGGPPSLPDYNDAVSSALNLYRFILMTEATEKTNNTGILSKDKLIKAYKEWLLPLRSLVLGTVEKILNDEENDQKADMVCAFNPLEFVLQHCIQLVEEKLEHL